MATAWCRAGAVAVAIALALTLVGCSNDGGDGNSSPTSRPTSSVTSSTSGPATTLAGPSTTATDPAVPATTVPLTDSRDLLAAACADGLEATRGAVVSEPLVTEVSGVAPGGDRTWVVNDSGDDPRLYGIAADGSAQVVAVTGAEAVDWEDLAHVGGDDPHLWIADTGGNNQPRATVQLYRVPVPAPGVTEVAAERVDVAHPDGPLDVEGVIADPAGPLYLLSKEPARSQVLRVDPPAGGGAVDAEPVGEFRPGEGPMTVVTSAAISPDGRVLAVRSYGGAFLYPRADGQSVPDALADSSARCRVPTGVELQGEAIGFLADGSGYVTIAEGASPAVTTIRPRG